MKEREQVYFDDENVMTSTVMKILEEKDRKNKCL